MNQLKNSTPEKLRESLNKQNNRRQENKKNSHTGDTDVWAVSVFNHFLLGYGKKDADTPDRFGYWMVTEGALVEGSAETLLFSLQRTKQFTKAEKKEARAGMKEGLKEGPNVLPQEKNPCNTRDANDIVEGIPDNWYLKKEMSAAILLASECGARAISICNLKLDDISVLPTGETRVKFDYGKGRRKWGHLITLSAESNAAKWLRLLESDISCSEDVLNSRFQTCSELAGYEKGYFSFHSLRSGFACSAFVTCGRTNSVLEDTGFVGGWKVGGKVSFLCKYFIHVYFI